MSVKIVATLHCNTDAEETFELELKKLIDTSLLDEGCLRYELYQYDGEPCHYVFLEEWQNEELLNKHRQSSHYKHFMRVAPVLLASPAEIKVLTRLL